MRRTPWLLVALTLALSPSLAPAAVVFSGRITTQDEQVDLFRFDIKQGATSPDGFETVRLIALDAFTPSIGVFDGDPNSSAADVQLVASRYGPGETYFEAVPGAYTIAVMSNDGVGRYRVEVDPPGVAVVEPAGLFALAPAALLGRRRRIALRPAAPSA